jgi:hypothetical protein
VLYILTVLQIFHILYKYIQSTVEIESTTLIGPSALPCPRTMRRFSLGEVFASAYFSFIGGNKREYQNTVKYFAYFPTFSCLCSKPLQGFKLREVRSEKIHLDYNLSIIIQIRTTSIIDLYF